MKIGTKVVFCMIMWSVAVIMCFRFYSVSTGQTYYEYNSGEYNRMEYIIIEDCQARIVDMPEGYCVYSEDNEIVDNPDGMKVVEFTCYMTNTMSDIIRMEHIVGEYYGNGKEALQVMSMDRDKMYLEGYDRKILPPGERVFFRNYVVVPEELNEMDGYFHTISYKPENPELIRITF